VSAAALLAACGLSLSHTATVGPTPTRCADGLPALVLQALTCPNGYCGFTCAPGRWDTPRCP
jgi:hypothetical protein